MSIQITGWAAGLPTTGGTLTGPLAIAVGSAAAPGLAVAGDANTGLFAPAADVLAVATGGVEAIRVTGAQFVGVGTTVPLAKLHIGAGTTNNSVDSQLLISRLVDDTVAGSGHAFSDSSNVSRSGAIGYNSFDARINFSGSNNYDHNASFQSAPIYGSSGTMSNCYGLYSALNINSGTIMNNSGVRVTDPTGAGTVGTNFGIQIDSLTKGVTNNYAIYTAGTTKSYFGGDVHFAGNIGIGRIPTTRLDLYGTNQRILMLDTGTGYQNIKLQNSGSSMYVVQEQSTGGGVVSGSAAYSGVVGTGAAYPLHLITNASIKATITSTGNVGIGTTEPTAALHLPGSTTALASLRIPAGTAPTAPNAGDVWVEGTVLKFFDGTTTKVIAFV